MKNKLFLLLCFVVFCSHDMYLKLDTYFLERNQESVIDLYNGTFDKSDNVIDRDRMIDISLIGNGNRVSIKTDQWTEKDSITSLNFTTGDPGTWVAGVSTKPREIEMEATAFNKYLKNDGVTDLLESRQENGLLENDAVERYSKHVKAIFQVGDKKTEDWKTELGYPIEFIPQSNPYEAHTGDTLTVRLLRDGKPLTNQLVYADYRPSRSGHSHNAGKEHSHDNGKIHSHDGDEQHSHENNEAHTHGSEEAHTNNTKETHSHDDDEHSHDNGKTSHNHTNEGTIETETNDHVHTSGQKLRTDENGLIDVKLTADGIWYLRTIHLIPSTESGLTHESNWATLTFEVQHSHDADNDVHTHQDSIPSYIYWIGSLLIIGGLFFWFNRKK